MLVRVFRVHPLQGIKFRGGNRHAVEYVQFFLGNLTLVTYQLGEGYLVGILEICQVAVVIYAFGLGNAAVDCCKLGRVECGVVDDVLEVPVPVVASSHVTLVTVTGCRWPSGLVQVFLVGGDDHDVVVVDSAVTDAGYGGSVVVECRGPYLLGGSKGRIGRERYVLFVLGIVRAQVPCFQSFADCIDIGLVGKLVLRGGGSRDKLVEDVVLFLSPVGFLV